LYVHVAYSYDLQELMGRDAWYDLATITKIRKEFPNFPPPTDWDLLRHQQKMRDQLDKLDERLPPPKNIQEFREYWGGDPRLTYSQGQSGWSIWFHVADPAAVQAVHIGILLVMLLFTIGFCTRVTSVLTWLAAVSYINRSPVSVFGQDTMMNVALI